MTQSRTSKVVALSLGQGLTTAVSIVSVMVIARVLTKGELATYRQTLLAYAIVSPILSLGLVSALYYFLPTETKRTRGIVVDGLLMMLAMGMLYSLFIACGGNHLLAKRFSNPDIVQLLLYFIPYPLIMLPAGLLSAVMVVRERVTQLSIYNVISNIILFLGIIGACLLWKTPQSMIIARVVISLLTGIVAITFMLRVVPKDDWLPHWNNMKTMALYSIPLSWALSLDLVSSQLDKLIVSAMCSTEEFAIYYTGAFGIPLIGIVTGSIGTVIRPELRILFEAGKNIDALALYRRAAEKSAWILFPVMMFLMVSADSFISMMFSDKYSESVLPFRVYLLLLPSQIVSFNVMLMAIGQIKAIIYRACGFFILNVILSIVFVKWKGYIGAAWAAVITTYVWVFLSNMYFISRALKVRWGEILPYGKLIKIFYLLLIPTLFCAFINQVHFSIKGVQLLVNAAVYGGIAWLFCRRQFMSALGRITL